MKTNIYDAPMYSLIVLFAILVVGGALAFYPPHFDNVRNEATPIGITEKRVESAPKEMPANNVESPTTSVDASGKIELY